MESEQVLQLMDSCWFHRPIFHTNHESPTPPKSLHHENEDKAMLSRPKNLQARSHSDRCIAVDLEAGSPRSVIIKPKVQQIPELSHAGREKREKHRMNKRHSRSERGMMSRSLSALEFEELKGFMDLGFVFDEEETNPGLASIIPGLQKRGKMAAVAAGGCGGGEVEISRPYLSEAWGDLNRKRKVGNVLMNWKSAKNEMDVKDHLKIWAHVVASIVR